MELFREFRLKMGNSSLEKRIVKARRKVSYTGINSIRTIGMVWDASRTEEFSILSRFHLQMQEKGISVTLIGYYPGKELPDQYTALKYFTCLRRKELNAVYLPVSVEADKFITTKFDILIDINFNRELPLIYISSLSAASFKVGLFEKESDNRFFDLMMELKKPVNVDDYLRNVIHYLEMIRSGKNEQVEKGHYEKV